MIRLGLGLLFEAGVFLSSSFLSELVVIEDILEDRTGDGTAATSELLLLFLSLQFFLFVILILVLLLHPKFNQSNDMMIMFLIVLCLFVVCVGVLDVGCKVVVNVFDR